MSKTQTKKVVFFYDKYVNSTIMVTHFIEILLVLEFQLTKFIIGTFSYKAHFRPQISSNATDNYKSQGTQWSIDSYSKINDLNSMEWNSLKGGN